MKGHWKAGLGGVAAFVAVFFVRRHFGTAASVVTVAVLLFAWWLLHIYTEKRVGSLYKQFQHLDPEQKEQALNELDPEIRKDIETRIAQEKNFSSRSPGR
jgi:hypothetical protein